LGTTVSVGGGNKNVVIYGNGTVFAGNGNDTITIGGQGSVVAGNGNDSITIFGKGGTVTAGNGNDSITVDGKGQITVGSGNDTIGLFGSGTIDQNGQFGNDTITLGFGNDTIFEAGHATLQGIYGDASISGGTLAFTNTASVHIEDALSGKATLVGGQFSNEFIGGTGTTVMKGGLGNDTFVGGSGNETMTGGAGSNVFAFVGDAGGTHIITNFVSGQDHLYVEGYTLAQLTNDISVHNGNTYIKVDGGATTIELVGVTHLSSTDITKHKP
jgi:Ca2+-binding RTX toxin-like protein